MIILTTWKRRIQRRRSNSVDSNHSSELRRGEKSSKKDEKSARHLTRQRREIPDWPVDKPKVFNDFVLFYLHQAVIPKELQVIYWLKAGPSSIKQFFVVSKCLKVIWNWLKLERPLQYGTYLKTLYSSYITFFSKSSELETKVNLVWVS